MNDDVLLLQAVEDATDLALVLEDERSLLSCLPTTEGTDIEDDLVLLLELPQQSRDLLWVEVDLHVKDEVVVDGNSRHSMAKIRW